MGWVPIGNLKVGDFLCSPKGGYTKVNGIFPKGEEEILRVTFQDGSWTECDWEHIWSVRSPYDKNNGIPFRTLDTHQLVSGGLKQKNGNRRWHIPLTIPVQFYSPKLEIDPHMLGVILGDGTITKKGEVRFSTDRELLPFPQFGTFRNGCWYQSSIVYNEQLVELGLLGKKAHEKFVPEPYLLGTPEERLALLQGLMDTDGYAMPDGGAEFSSTSPALIDAVMELTQSLGGIARNRAWCASTYDYLGKNLQGRPAERVNIKLPAPLIPFRLIRKSKIYKVPIKYSPARLIDSIVSVGVKEAVCISVDSPDGLYITRNYIVTHNTVCTIAAIEQLIAEGWVAGGLLIVPSALKYQWAREIDKFTDGANVLVIDGTPKQRREQYLRVKAGEVEYAIMNYEQVVKDFDIVSLLPRDFIVLDEATYIKGPGAKRTKQVQKLVATYQWALTGQPVENKAEELYSIMKWVDPDVLGDYRLFDTTFISRDKWGKVRRYKNLPLLYKTVAEAMVRAKWSDPGIREQMPRIVEDTRLVQFNKESAQVYMSIASDLRYELSQMRMGGFDLDAHYMGSGNHDEGAGTVMSRMMALRMISDHPDLIRWSASTFGKGGASGSSYCAELVNDGRMRKLLGEPKLEATVDLIKEILEEDPANKIVLFSYFKYMLDLLGDATEHLTINTKFTGDMNAKQKDAAKVQFQTDPTTRLFLSSDAGGYGVDLPQANYLLSYDLPFSAGAWAQRNARIIRLSTQFEHVTLISILMSGSIEERIYAALTEKQSISDAIVDGRGIDQKGNLNLSLKSLTEFLDTSPL